MVLAAMAALVIASPLHVEAPLIIGSNGQKVIRLEPTIRGFAFGDEREGCPAPASLRTLGNQQWLLIGEALGESTLLLFGATGVARSQPVKIRSGECDLHICSVCKEMPADRTSEFRMLGSQIYLAGTFGSLDEAIEGYALAERHPKVLIVTARLSPRALRQALMEANHLLGRAGLFEVRVVVRDGVTAIDGPPLQGDAAARAEKVTATVRARLDQVLLREAQRSLSLPERITSPCRGTGW